MKAQHINTANVPDNRTVVVTGNTERISQTRLALNTFTLYRSAGCARFTALQMAVRAFRQRS